MTVLVLLAASARAGIVASHLLLHVDWSVGFLLGAVGQQDPDSVATEGRERHTDLSRMQSSRPDLLTNSSEQKSNAPVHVEKKVGRNDPCPCGSGKKYKNCHGKEV